LEIVSMVKFRVVALSLVAVLLQFSLPAFADTAKVIDDRVDAALARFVKDVDGGQKFLDSAAGVLVFPKVVKAGFIIAGEGGEGALRVGGKTVQYYNTLAGSFGLQAGATSKSVYLLFMTQKALSQFRDSSGWEAGVDGSVTLVDAGAAGSVDTTGAKDAILGFVLTNAGLMADISLSGSKYNKIEPDKE
jgi:lipid-binding SYLF domain-containing protein